MRLLNQLIRLPRTLAETFPRFMTAYAMCASLLATASVTTRAGRRASSELIHAANAGTCRLNSILWARCFAMNLHHPKPGYRMGSRLTSFFLLARMMRLLATTNVVANHRGAMSSG